jgi:hypothetical protein
MAGSWERRESILACPLFWACKEKDATSRRARKEIFLMYWKPCFKTTTEMKIKVSVGSALF